MRILKQEVYFPIIVAIHFIFWGIDLYFYDGDFMEISSDTLLFGELTNESWKNIHRILGEVFSSWVVTVFAFNFLMATRAKVIERLFGGLDKMYLIHRRSGVIAVVLLIAHFVVVPRDLTAFNPGKPMGFYAFVLILIGVLLSASPFFKRKLPYHKWINFHKLMGVFYLLGVIHGLMVNSLISELPITRIYVFGMSFIGLIAWVYRAFLFRIFNRKFQYKIVGIEDKGNEMIEIKLNACSDRMKYLAGQFAFFTFPTINKREQHPFTISSHPFQDELRITVKGLGDFTENLIDKIEKDDLVEVEGPYGHFSSSYIKEKDQIWIAGGIGITPFLSLANDVYMNKVKLIWCVSSPEEAVYEDELKEVVEKNPQFNYEIWPTNKKGHLTAEMIVTDNYLDKGFLLCGPSKLKKNIYSGLQKIGVNTSHIYDEEFSFR